MSLGKIERKLIAGTFVTASLLLVLVASDAMPISQFDAMSKDDQARYSNEVFGNSVKMLRQQGRKEEAQKVMDLFDLKPGEKLPQGVHEMLDILAGLRKMPSEKAYHVEHAMGVMLRRHGVNFTPSDLKELVLIAKDFKPSDKQYAEETR